MSGTPTWQTLATTFENTANALSPQLAGAADDAAQQAVLDKQGQLRLAAEQLIGGAVDAAIASMAGLTATLTQATKAAQTATTVVADIAAAAELVGSLVSLATAIVGIAANPGAVLTAAEGVINAAQPYLPGNH